MPSDNSDLKTILFNKKRLTSAIVLLLFILLCSFPLFSLSLTEDISTMIPQGENDRIANDFKLLQKAPLSGNVLITISSPTAKPNQLAEIADSLTSKMQSPYLLLQDYSGTTPQEIISFLLKHSSNLTTDKDLHELKKRTSNEAISSELISIKRQLLSPSGLGMKRIITADPLGLRLIYLQKLDSLKNLPRFKIQGKHFFNNDKTAILLIARTEIPMTDSLKGRSLLNHFKQIKEQALNDNKNISPGVEISLLSGHLYTDANATTIKRDILVVSAISICALSLLFIFSFRRAGALTIFLAPAVAIIAGLGAAAFVFPALSAIVIGFGAVLMGISIDFAVHTYFALADSPQDRSAALKKVSSPVLFGAATSCASFAALYVSGIPGIKQLAVFSVIGIIAACAYALLFIPYFCGNFTKAKSKKTFLTPPPKHKTASICISLFIIIAGLFASFSNSFDTELKHLGYISDQIRNTETIFKNKWGNLRAQAMLFAQGETYENALENNENIWSDLTENFQQIKAVSLAPLLPSEKTQQQNSIRWRDFWTDDKISKTSLRLDTEGRKLGFTPNIFHKSIQTLQQTGPQISPANIYYGPLGFLADMLIPETETGEQKLVMTLLPDNEQVTSYYTPQKEQKLGARLISQSRFKATLETEMKSDIIKFICFSGLLVTLLILILFRNLRRATLALFPAIFGVVTTFGLLGLLQIPLNIFHIVALPLVIGLGADYGIFMVFQEIKEPAPSTIKAVKISGMTTLAGFGVLVFARHPSLHSLGATVATGVSAALICAVFILPHLLRMNNKNENGNA